MTVADAAMGRFEIGRVFTRARIAILAAAAVTGLFAIALQGLELSSGSSPALVALTVLSFLTSAWVFPWVFSAILSSLMRRLPARN